MMIPSSWPGIIARTWKKTSAPTQETPPPPTLDGDLNPDITLCIASHAAPATRASLVQLNTLHHKLVAPLLYGHIAIDTRPNHSLYEGVESSPVASSEPLSSPSPSSLDPQRLSKTQLLGLVKEITVQQGHACDHGSPSRLARSFTGLNIVRIIMDLTLEYGPFCGLNGTTECELVTNLSAEDLVLVIGGYCPDGEYSRTGFKSTVTAVIANGVQRLTIVIPDTSPDSALKVREWLGIDKPQPIAPATPAPALSRLSRDMSRLSLGDVKYAHPIAPPKDRLVLGRRGGAAMGGYTASTEEIQEVLEKLVRMKKDAMVYYIGEELKIGGFPVDERIMATEFGLIREKLRDFVDDVQGKDTPMKVVLKGYEDYVADGCRRDVAGW